jgi:hypothetical protein
LASGRPNFEARVEQAKEIERQAFQREELGKTNRYSIDGHDYRFFFGDFNFRVDMGNSEIREKIEE